MTQFPGNSSKTRVAQTEDLIAVCEEADVKERLRRDLDPDAWHVMRVHFFHDSTMLIRTVWIVKTKTGSEIALVDVKPEALDSFLYFEDIPKG